MRPVAHSPVPGAASQHRWGSVHWVHMQASISDPTPSRRVLCFHKRRGSPTLCPKRSQNRAKLSLRPMQGYPHDRPGRPLIFPRDWHPPRGLGAEGGAEGTAQPRKSLSAQGPREDASPGVAPSLDLIHPRVVASEWYFKPATWLGYCSLCRREIISNVP